MPNDPTPNHGLHRYTEGDTNWTHSDDMGTIETRLPLRDAESNRNNYEPYDNAIFLSTDTGRVFEGSGGSWVAADRKFGQLEANNILVDGNAAASQDWVSANFNDYTFSESYLDLSDVPATFTPETHGSGAHSEDYALATELFSGSYTDLTDVPLEFTPATHGDGAHTEDYALSSELFSGSYGDLSGVPTTFDPSTHGAAAHSEDYATTSDEVTTFGGSTGTDGQFLQTNGTAVSWATVDAMESHGNEFHDATFATTSELFSGNYADLTNVPSTFDPSTHGNTAHSSTFATETWVGNNFNNYTFSESYTDLTNRAHGNEDHSSTFATTSELFSGNYADLSGRSHGNEDHDADFAALGANETVTGDWTFELGSRTFAMDTGSQGDMEHLSSNNTGLIYRADHNETNEWSGFVPVLNGNTNWGQSLDYDYSLGSWKTDGDFTVDETLSVGLTSTFDGEMSMNAPTVWSPGNRPGLRFDPTGSGTDTNALFEFEDAANSNNRTGYFGWMGGSNVLRFASQVGSSDTLFEVGNGEATIGGSTVATEDYADTVFMPQGLQNVTGSRSAATTYQNTTNATLYVKIIFRAEGNDLRLELLKGPDSGSLQRADFVRDGTGSFPNGDEIWRVVSTFVPPGYYYRVDDGIADAYMIDWIEEEMAANF